MKKLLSILLLLSFCAALVYAQDGPPPRMNPKDRTAELKKKLKLTDTQVAKVDSIFQDNQKKMDEMMQNGPGGNMEEGRKAMDEMMQNTDKSIMKVLNAEQKVIYKKMIEERKKQMEEMMPPPPEGR